MRSGERKPPAGGGGHTLLLHRVLLAGAVVMLARATARILSRIDHRPPAEAGS